MLRETRLAQEAVTRGRVVEQYEEQDDPKDFNTSRGLPTAIILQFPTGGRHAVARSCHRHLYGAKLSAGFLACRIEGNAVESLNRVEPSQLVRILECEVERSRHAPSIVAQPPRVEAALPPHELGDAGDGRSDLRGLIGGQFAVPRARPRLRG